MELKLKYWYNNAKLILYVVDELYPNKPLDFGINIYI